MGPGYVASMSSVGVRISCDYRDRSGVVQGVKRINNDPGIAKYVLWDTTSNREDTGESRSERFRHHERSASFIERWRDEYIRCGECLEFISPCECAEKPHGVFESESARERLCRLSRAIIWSDNE